MSAADERAALFIRLIHRVLDDTVSLQLTPHNISVDEYRDVHMHFARSVVGEDVARAAVDTLGDHYGLEVETGQYASPTLYTRRGRVDGDFILIVYCGQDAPEPVVTDG